MRYFLLLSLLSLVASSPRWQADQRGLRLVHTSVQGTQVDLWLSPVDQPFGSASARPELREDGVPQAQVTLFPIQQQPVDIAVVVSTDAPVSKEWFFRVLQTILYNLPDGSAVSLSLCGASEPELVSTTRDRNLVLNSFIQAHLSGGGAFGQPCDLGATIASAMAGFDPVRNLQPLSRQMLIVLGAVPANHLPTSSLSWAVVPDDASVARHDDVRVLVMHGEESDADDVVALSTSVRAQSQILHLQYQSTALPGSHQVHIRYPTNRAVEMDVTIPVIPPAVKLRPPDTSQFAAKGVIMLGVDVTFQQSPLKQVRYYVDDELIGTARSAPFDLRWQAGAMPGNHTLRAEVTDQYDATAFTPRVTVSTVVTVHPNDYRLPLLAAGLAGLIALLYIWRRMKALRPMPIESIPAIKGPIPELKIRVTYYGGASSVHMYRRTSVTVGSDPELAILSLTAVGVEPLHVTLRQRARGVVVEPYGHTLLSGQVLDGPTLIPVGGELEFGNVMLRLEAVFESSATTQHQVPDGWWDDGTTLIEHSNLEEGMSP